MRPGRDPLARSVCPPHRQKRLPAGMSDEERMLRVQSRPGFAERSCTHRLLNSDDDVSVQFVQGCLRCIEFSRGFHEIRVDSIVSQMYGAEILEACFRGDESHRYVSAVVIGKVRLIESANFPCERISISLEPTERKSLPQVLGLLSRSGHSRPLCSRVDYNRTIVAILYKHVM